ncbi:hypothetical protein DPMN_006728 [Dreissena polymorpha]|uniref:Uncharacterized protein n=1 Tax=Dreissena polymorpha TaxID=45954 RepID=A0A9D4MSF1_DREPO|nr:hypothetical protein DPMN_006728 [Dreissena polymorpha]
MAQAMFTSSYAMKMNNRERIQQFANTVLNHGVKRILVSEVESGVFLSPNDYSKIEKLSQKLEQNDAKLAQYKSLKLRTQNLMKGIKKTKNLQDDVVKTVSSNVLDRVPIDVINKILGSGEDENMFALIERIKSSNVEEKRQYADIDISDTEMSDTMNDNEKETMNALAVKRMRKSGEKSCKKLNRKRLYSVIYN